MKSTDATRHEGYLIRSHENELGELDTRLREARTRYTECVNELKRHETQSKSLKLDVQRAEVRCDAAQDEIDNNIVEHGRLEALRTALEELEEKKSTTEGQWQANRIAKDEKHAELKSHTEMLKNIDGRISDVQKQINETEENLQQAEEARGNALVSKNRVFEAVEVARGAIERLTNQRTQQAERVTEWQAQANEVGPRVRVDPGETADSLDTKLEKLRAEIQRSENRFESATRYPCRS